MYPFCTIATTGLDQCGSILHDCRVVVETADVLDTPCHGAFCDQKLLLKGESMSSRCACIQMNKSGKIAVVWGLRIELPNGPVLGHHLQAKVLQTSLFSEELCLSTQRLAIFLTIMLLKIGYWRLE